ncbi:hypothetical protein HHI36_008276 [Cryptolaemus montrouzieri]|uniref:Ionotropic glutamate receptor L-glutamate and glycine-binding domain-containing protein n=1 Tax=Cryptolaemus montrouzieri TaxID=559131 RepID=A0ABD2MRZ7_9CUCU
MGDVKKKNSPWFELITVPFPSPVTSILVPKRLDIYSKGNFRRGTDLFREKTIDLKNQTLKVVTFSHTPGTKKNQNATNHLNLTDNMSSSFNGAEIEILKTVSMAMNFNYEIYEPENSDVELWGRKDSGARYTGLIGEMVYTHADIALGDLYYIPTILNLMDLTIPYNTECLTFVTPEALTDNSWKTLILPFSGYMWLGVLLCLLMSATAFCLLARFHDHVSRLKEEYESNIDVIHVKKKKVITLTIFPEVYKMDNNVKYNMMKGQYNKPIKEGQAIGLYQFSEPVNCLLYTYSMLLLVSLPKLPTGWSLRIFTGWYWLYSLLVVVAYRSSLTAILARPVPRVTIDTLQELYDSKIACGSWGEINREFFKTALDPILRVIGETFETVNNSDDAIDRVADGKFAFYENTYFLKEAIVERQLRFQASRNKGNSTNDTEVASNIVEEDRSLHIMGDCVINMPISIGLQKNSPIKPRFDKHIRRVLEGGLIKKWLDDAMQKILNTEIQTNNKEEIKALMSMKKFSGALVVLFIGYVSSMLFLIGEILHFNLVIKRDPNYNKYSRSIVKNLDRKFYTYMHISI